MTGKEAELACSNLKDQFINGAIDRKAYISGYIEIFKEQYGSISFFPEDTLRGCANTQADTIEHMKSIKKQSNQRQAKCSNTTTFFSPSPPIPSSTPRHYHRPNHTESTSLTPYVFLLAGVLGIAAMCEPIGWGVAALILAISPTFFVIAAALYTAAIAACFIGAYVLYKCDQAPTDVKESSFAPA